MNNRRQTAIIYTILHFLVDFATVFLISGILIGPVVGIVNRGEVIVVYNLIAFAGQLPIGMVADALGKNRLVVALGCVLACISYPLSIFLPWVACVLAALGNGAFHIGAGSDILRMSMPKAALSGLFVSSGALGVWLAYKAEASVAIWLCPVLMLVASIWLFITDKSCKKEEKISKIRFEKPSAIVLLAVSCFALTIVIRSLLGMIMNFSWKTVPMLSLVFVMAVAGGKALGGFLGDRFGYIKTAAISLAVSLVSFVFSFNCWIAGTVAVLCFNMTMPLTLTAIAGVSNQKYGFAFGVTTFALAVGFIPVVFGANDWFGVSIIVGGVFVSLILMVLGYILLKKHAVKVRGGSRCGF